MSAPACLPFPGSTLCGYCEHPLTLQPAGDWACTPCRQLMADIVTGPVPLLDAQWAAMQRVAAKRRPAPVERNRA